MKTHLIPQACLLWTFLFTVTACHEREKDPQEVKEPVDTVIRKDKPSEVQRFGMVIRIKPEKIETYKKLHGDPWQGIINMIRECNIRNYSIYLKDDLLFSYFEYTGTDFEADMRKMAADSLTREWWKLTDACQIPLETRGEGEWWAQMEEVFHLE